MDVLRAVTPKGPNYEFIVQGKLPSPHDFIVHRTKLRKELIAKRRLVKKSVKSIEESKLIDDALFIEYTNQLLDFLGDSVKYIKYK